MFHRLVSITIRSEQSPDVSNHDGSTVASKGVLQEPGEFAVAVGNMHQLALCNQQEKNKQSGRYTLKTFAELFFLCGGY